jgi:hypothetical protein
LSRRPANLEVRTPYTVAGVRGTEFLVEVTDEATELSVFEGTVLAANEAGSLAVSTGLHRWAGRPDDGPNGTLLKYTC